MAEQVETKQESRKDVIAAAVDVANKEDAKSASTEETNKTETTEKTEVPKEATEEAKKKEDELISNGKILIEALNDPLRAPVVIKFLAEQAGYKKVEPSDKQEVKEIKTGIVEDLKESLGAEFEFLADKLAPGIEKYLNKKLKESQEDIRAQLEEQESEKLKLQSASALTKLSQDFFASDDIPDNVSKEMSSYMDRVQPSATMSVKEYIEDAFYASIGKLGLSKTTKAQQERSKKNSNDVPSRLNGASERVPLEENLQKSSKPMTRQEAIKAAIEAVEKG